MSLEAERLGLVLEEHQKDASEGTALHALLPPTKDLRQVSWLEEETAATLGKARTWVAHHAEGAEEVLYEVPLELWLDGKLILWGTADVVVVFADSSHKILDLKFGRAELERDFVYWQILAYMVAYGLSRRPRSVSGFAFQPRNGAELSLSAMGIPQLEEQALAIRGVIDRASLSTAAVFRGPAQCRLCPGKPVCPAWKEELALVRPKEHLPETIDQLERLVQLCSVVEQVGPAARNRLKELIQAGAKSSLYEVRQKRHDTPKDVETVFAVVDGVLTQEEFLACCEVQLTRLKKALKAKGGGIGGCVTEGTSTYLRKKGSAE